MRPCISGLELPLPSYGLWLPPDRPLASLIATGRLPAPTHPPRRLPCLPLLLRPPAAAAGRQVPYPVEKVVQRQVDARLPAAPKGVPVVKRERGLEEVPYPVEKVVQRPVP